MRQGRLWLFLLYVALILWCTLLSRRPGDCRVVMLEPFWAVRAWLNGEESGASETLQYFGNVLLFIPFGFLFPGKKGKWTRVLLAGAALSLSIEAAQYVFSMGWSEADDVAANAAGALIGFWARRLDVGKRGRIGMLRDWEDLPKFMRIPEVRPYWEALDKKRGQLALKRAFDLCAALALLAVLAVPLLAIAVMIKLDGPGPALYRQERLTAYGRRFRIHKFRTMVDGADKLGAAVTSGSDARITKIGARLRKYRLDELPQLFDVLAGDMSFVGARPEAVKYVKAYRPEFYATLLLPAGITSEASIRFKDEGRLLDGADDVEKEYVEKVLPEKMRWNLRAIKEFSFWREIGVMVRTVWAVR